MNDPSPKAVESRHISNQHYVHNIAVMLATVLLAFVFSFTLLGCTSSDEASDSAGSSDTSDSADSADASDSVTDEEIAATREELNASVYNTEAQAEIRADLDAEIESESHTEDNPYIASDPFGTNTLSWYVYFTTDDAVTVTYTVQGDEDEGIVDFSQTPSGGDDYSTEHEFQVIGLIPGKENTVILTLTNENGTARKVTLTGDVPELKGVEEEQLEMEDGESSEELANGLYVILGNDSTGLDFMYYYDNTGQIRGEIPIISFRAHRLLFDDEGMYYSISTTKMARVDSLGQVTAVYDTGDYELHHDYAFDDDGNILSLASDAYAEATTDSETNHDDTRGQGGSVEDKVIKIDVDTGEVSEVLDLADLFGDIKESAQVASDGDLDWIHLNTIQWLGDETILLSSRETSTIIKVTNLYSSPTIDYLIGNDTFWGGTNYEDLLLTKIGDFSDNGGQHSVTYLEDDSLEDGQYYLLVYDNNFGISESYPDMDWSALGDDVATTYEDGTESFGRLFLVDENERSYELLDEISVPFSGYVSSIQLLDNGNILIDSGQPGIFQEFDSDGNLVEYYQMNTEKFVYRVYKYDFDGFYFD